ncbi:CLUMA_CG011474, isoform A [Clunio marinus]|uniref:CLUMA_CG011474, isoform A n=1 Tax=Clunio marinus TaxID=568069 RepID=A0A1J1IEB1_9DIPT|nr:CLUMA_CG011474, isoform A [Clunio marinus]
MSKQEPPPYNFIPPPSAPPPYSQAVNGVDPAAPLTPQQPILTAQHIVTTIIPLGPHATHTICPSCGAEVNTKTRTSPGVIAYVSGFIIAALGCWLGCCLIPCCIDECMDTHHYCPACGSYLGRHRR